jgi:hypothetical protein
MTYDDGVLLELYISLGIEMVTIDRLRLSEKTKNAIDSCLGTLLEGMTNETKLRAAHAVVSFKERDGKDAPV